MMPEKVLMKLSDYSQLTGRSYSSALRDVKSGRIRSIRIGKTILIPTDAIYDLYRSGSTNESTPTSEEAKDDQ